MNRPLIQTSMAFVLLVLVGCFAQAQMSHEHGHSESIDRAVAVLHPTEGNEVRGVVIFEATDEGQVKVMANVVGLTPDSRHGFHVHEFGDTTAADGTSAGGHYNPEGHDHALPSDEPRHAGDLGNLEADSNGRARLELTVDNLSINGHTNPILGRGVVVHADPDDGGQPTGNAGARLAVGVIGVAQPRQ